MELTVGTIITGKVTSITKFGAFVALPEDVYKRQILYPAGVCNSHTPQKMTSVAKPGNFCYNAGQKEGIAMRLDKYLKVSRCV